MTLGNLRNCQKTIKTEGNINSNSKEYLKLVNGISNLATIGGGDKRFKP